MDDDSTEELSMVPLTTSSQPVDNAISKIEELGLLNYMNFKIKLAAVCI